MRIFVFLILLFLFSFKANSEVVNLKFLCKGTFDATNKSGTITYKSNDEIISIKDNVLQDRNYIKLKVLEDKIFRMIDDSPNKLGFLFSLNRYTGDLDYHKSPKYSGTEYRIHFAGKCKKLKSKKF
ncbi:hypothetical protein OAK51_05565 [Alphaproteobacteria bacterium]|nr:hypothetical protein [Alphaproteobacteria bacterium]